MALIPEEIVSQVIDRNDIVDLISSYIPLKRAGRNFKAPCPFHNEKTPSFVVNPDKQIFHCFGCGIGGNVITFIIKHDHVAFPEAVRILAQRANVVIPSPEARDSKTDNDRQQIFAANELALEYFHNNLLSDKAQAAIRARDYLQKRSVRLETVKRFKLGFALDEWDGLINYLRDRDVTLAMMEKAGLIIKRENREGYYDRFRNRVIFPILDTQNHCRAFGARTMDAQAAAKYINSPETLVYRKGNLFYGFDLAKNAILGDDRVLVVEGYMDCILPSQEGVVNVVASCGTALTVEQIRLLRRYTKNVVMLFDADAAGEAAMLRSLDTLVEEDMTVRVAQLDREEDPDSFIREHGVDKFNARIESAQSLFDYKLEVLSKKYDRDTIEGKAKIASELLPTLAKFNNAVIQSGYLKQLSAVLAIKEDALLIELQKVETHAVKGWKGHFSGEPVAQKQPGSQRTVEINILKLLLADEEYIPIAQQHIDVSDFQDARVRDIMSKIYELFAEKQKFQVADLLNSFSDVSVHQMITEIVADDDNIPGDKEKICRDLIKRMKDDRLKMKRQNLLGQIRKAEIAGDHDRLEDLKGQFNQLIKG